MAEDKNQNGQNGSGNGSQNGGGVKLLTKVRTKVLAGVKEDVQVLKVDLPAKAKEQVELVKDPTKTQVYTSIFRHKHDDTPRNRALGVLSNVFLHLHPAKINRDSVRYSYTWGMGGITFYLFIVLTFTGVLLMFYYHPQKVDAFRDILYLEHDVPFGKLLRNMHRWAAHLMVITTWLHMFRVVLTGSYKRPREFNWCVGVVLLVLTLLLSFTGYLLPDDQLGFWAVTVGTNMARATPMLGHEGPFGAQLGLTAYNDVRFGLLGGSIVDSNALLRSYIWHCIGIPLVASIFMAVHFWRIRKDGGISGPPAIMLQSELKALKKKEARENTDAKNGMEKFVNKWTLLVVAVLLVGLWFFTMQDRHQLWMIASAPDNIPIVAMLFLVPFFTWLGVRQAVANDRLIKELETDPKLAKSHHRKA